ncbi:MAG: hypothetical protein RMI91_03565 [Gemmatales bacterium]|nr:hypothetical protein [Gemmatales bacterium]MDW7993710.1 hypothetical protein [Gemmatales bacterium]
MSSPTSAKTFTYRVGLIGDHPWARALVEALQQQGCRLIACAGPEPLLAWAMRWSPTVSVSRDAAQGLSHPEVDVLVLADTWPFRGELLAQAIQLDRSVFVIHPADQALERYYVVQLALEERRFPVWPIIPHRFFDGLARIRTWLQGIGQSPSWHLEVNIPINELKSLEIAPARKRPTLETDRCHPLWFWADWLRCLGGEIAEIYAVGEATSLSVLHAPLTVTGRWESGGHFIWRQAPGLTEGFRLQTAQGIITWLGATVEPGRHVCQYEREGQRQIVESSGESVWKNYAAWLLDANNCTYTPAQWVDAVAAAEIVQAIEESLRSRKAVSLLRQEYTESAVFKSQAASLGCGIIWLILVLAMISPLVPQALYLIPILLLGCLVLFAVGWLALRR